MTEPHVQGYVQDQATLSLGLPQLLQNLAPGFCGAPHPGQKAVCAGCWGADAETKTTAGCNCDCWRSSAEADESVTTPTSADTAGAVASRAMGTQDLSSATCSFRAVISSCSSGSLVIALGSVNNTDNVTLLFM